MEPKTISTIWAYLYRYDESSKPSFLSTAWTLFVGVLQKTEIPDDFETVGYTLRRLGPYHPQGPGIKTEQILINKENLESIVNSWLDSLLSSSHNPNPLLLEAAKATLIRLLVALDMVTNPIEDSVLEKVIEES